MATSVAQRRAEIENELRALMRQAEEMDAKIRAYLADRENKPHPRHHEFIEKIQRMKIEPAASNRHLETMLDNLQWKVYYYSRAWRQLWENAEAIRRSRARQQESPEPEGRPAAGSANRDKRIYSVDRLWEIQQRKLRAAGEDPSTESREQFVERIKKRYGRLASEKKPDEEIVMTFDRQARRCTLFLKKRERQ